MPRGKNSRQSRLRKARASSLRRGRRRQGRSCLLCRLYWQLDAMREESAAYGLPPRREGGCPTCRLCSCWPCRSVPGAGMGPEHAGAQDEVPQESGGSAQPEGGSLAPSSPPPGPPCVRRSRRPPSGRHRHQGIRGDRQEGGHQSLHAALSETDIREPSGQRRRGRGTGPAACRAQRDRDDREVLHGGDARGPEGSASASSLRRGHRRCTEFVSRRRPRPRP